MNELNLKILKLIKQNKCLKEIAKEFNLSEKQLYIRIKQLINDGYNLKASYCYNSDIYYSLRKDNKIISNNKLNIKMPKDTNSFRALVISDLHIGSSDSDIKLMNIVYDYAIKNNINVILNCGDLLEGIHTSDNKIIKTNEEQIKNLIKKYPYDRNINNFVLYGNHDNHFLHYDGINIARAINNARYDIIPVGFGQANIHVKNDDIILFHKLSDGYKPIINEEKLLLSGHGHMMKTKIKDIFWIGLPTLSYKSNNKTVDVVPGFVDLNIDFENSKFEYIEAKHMIITPKVIQVSETRGKVKNLFNNTK